MSHKPTPSHNDAQYRESCIFKFVRMIPDSWTVLRAAQPLLACGEKRRSIINVRDWLVGLLVLHYCPLLCNTSAFNQTFFVILTDIFSSRFFANRPSLNIIFLSDSRPPDYCLSGFNIIPLRRSCWNRSAASNNCYCASEVDPRPGSRHSCLFEKAREQITGFLLGSGTSRLRKKAPKKGTPSG